MDSPTTRYGSGVPSGTSSNTPVNNAIRSASPVSRSYNAVCTAPRAALAVTSAHLPHAASDAPETPYALPPLLVSHTDARAYATYQTQRNSRNTRPRPLAQHRP